MGGVLISDGTRFGALRFQSVTNWDGVAQTRYGAAAIRTPHPEVVGIWDHLQMAIPVVYD